MKKSNDGKESRIATAYRGRRDIARMGKPFFYGGGLSGGGLDRSTTFQVAWPFHLCQWNDRKGWTASGADHAFLRDPSGATKGILGPGGRAS